MFIWGEFAGKETELRRAPTHRRARKFCGYSVASNKGWYSKDSFAGTLKPGLVKALVQASNNSLAVDTWASYGSIKKHMESCQRFVGRRFSFPMTHEDVVEFIGYMFAETSLKAASVANLLSALRTLHFTKGVFVPMLRPEIVTCLLKGRGNQDKIMSLKKNQRLPVTVDILLLLGAVLDLSDMDLKYKSMVWSVALLAFFGSFRIGELLSKTARTIDKSYDLLKRDVVMTTKTVGGKKRELLLVSLKAPKEAKVGDGPVVVEVFSAGGDICPVQAYKKYTELVGVKRMDSAAFRLPWSGEAYKHGRFNTDLKKLLGPHIHYGTVSGHSFRAGLSSLMASSGFKEEEVQMIGRWSSSALLRYVKKGRLVRCRYSDRIRNAVVAELENA